MTMGLIFWISAIVICVAMMRTTFKLLFKLSKSKR